jgi:hypothetical protein
LILSFNKKNWTTENKLKDTSLYLQFVTLYMICVTYKHSTFSHAELSNQNIVRFCCLFAKVDSDTEKNYTQLSPSNMWRINKMMAIKFS